MNHHTLMEKMSVRLNKRVWRKFRLFAISALAVSLLGACADTQGTRGVGPHATPLDKGGIRSLGNREDGGLIRNPFTNEHVRGTRLGLHNNSRVNRSEETARELEKMSEVDKAVVFLSETNAYVAMNLNEKAEHPVPGTNIPNGSDMEFGNYASDDRVPVQLKDRVGKRIRSLHPEVRNVFVSANPAFVRSMQEFVDRLERGQTMVELLEDFNETVSRVFPTRPEEGLNLDSSRPDALGSVPQRNAGAGRPFRYQLP